jgi:NTE family protein
LKSVALALGGGGARGIAHVVALEALDELGIVPTAIAGTSIGALIGAAYASGMTGRLIRRHIVDLVHARGEVMRRLYAARAAGLTDIITGFGNVTLVDAEKVCAQFLPDAVPDTFGELKIPLTVIASDLYARREVAIADGPLKSALAASIALPGLTRAVMREDRVLVDGGATNPLPFDHLRGKADIVVAVDISGGSDDARREIPGAIESVYATVLVMGSTITAHKMRDGAPDILIQPKVGLFRALDFLRASAILRMAEPVRTELKEKLMAVV